MRSGRKPPAPGENPATCGSAAGPRDPWPAACSRLQRAVDREPDRPGTPHPGTRGRVRSRPRPAARPLPDDGRGTCVRRGRGRESRSAAALWGVTDWPAVCEVSAPGHRRRPGLLTHRSRTLVARDVRRRHGVPVTSPVRTVLDLQPQLTDSRLIRLVNDLRTAGHLRAAAFDELCRRSRRVERLLGDGALTRSALEDLFRAFVARHGCRCRRSTHGCGSVAGCVRSTRSTARRG